MDTVTHRTPLRVGLIGFGMAGAVFHAPLIARTPGLELATVVTGHAARAAAAREQYPDIAVRPDLKDALAPQDLDLVVVASPNHVHVEQATLALQAGAHIVIDKPVAPTAAEVRRLERLAEQRELVAAAFHNRRWDSDFLTLRALLDSGRLGRVQRFESRFERWNPVPSRNWRESGDPAKAPGLLYDLGTHLIDQALQLFGPVASVYAESDIRRPGVRAPDDVFVALRHLGGEVSHLWMSKTAADTGPRMRVLGSQAAFVVLGVDQQVTDPKAPRLGTAQRAVLTHGAEEEPVTLLPGGYPDFYRGVESAIRGEGAPPVTLSEAAAVLDVIERAIHSSRTGAVVGLSL
ncbi:Gfo/Idh/MocA family oxidoreductase [Streptomyces sp. NPDC006739]|uniref:Gfo/Idh/MocA family protein n=1 Tax=Streptomyces sp. NPDC006739 TaxID=3364763 RepID=UPI0036A28535